MSATAFADRVGKANLIPMWDILRGMLPAEPRPTSSGWQC